jgi:hypothetical protein
MLNLIWYQISEKNHLPEQEAVFKNNKAFSGGKVSPKNALKNVCSISEYPQY